MMINRRVLMAGSLATVASAAVKGAPLADDAHSRRDGYGAAATLADLQSDVRLKNAITKYCNK